MKLIKLLSTATVLAIIGAAQAQAFDYYPQDNGFETPNLSNTPVTAAGNTQFGPTGTGWTFTTDGSTHQNTSGITVNGGLTGLLNATNGNHSGETSTYGQAAIIRSQASFDQVLGSSTAFVVGNTYTISFDYEGTSLTTSSSGKTVFAPDSFAVSVNGNLLQSFAPTASTTFTHATVSFVATAATEDLKFTGLTAYQPFNPSFPLSASNPNTEYDTYFDNPSVSGVPEPSDWAWIPVLGVLGFVAFRRFRTQSVA